MASLVHAEHLLTSPKATAGRVSRRSPAAALTCRAQAPSQDRRATLLSLVASVPTLTAAAPSLAAYGDSANVFGRTTNKSGYSSYVGDDFAVLIPSRWNPSKEREFPNIVLRYEDNAAAANNMLVQVEPTTKSKMGDFGTPEDFLQSVSYLLGKQSYSGETMSEGGFAPDRITAASVLDIATPTDKKGKTYYQYELLTRTADGDEGGRHYLIKATISNGNLYILKVTAGDKRWFKGANKDCMNVQSSFTVA